jgi:hypothetical protein
MSAMRRTALPIGIVSALAAASLAAAQDGPRPRVTVVIKSPPTSASAATPTANPGPALPGQPALRKPLGPAAVAAGRATPAHAFVSVAVAAPVAKGGGVTPLKGLNGPSASAVAAQCRAQCAQARYICTAQEAGDCDTVWGECVVRCSGSNYTSAPALAFSPPYRPGP